MLTNRIRVPAAVLLGIAAVVLMFHIPSTYRKQRAESFAQFAQDGVEVRVIGTVAGTGNPILVPGGIGLLMAYQYEAKNSHGETQRFVFCNGHPDDRYLVLAVAMTNSGREKKLVKFRSVKDPIEDPHDVGGWWLPNHLGFARYLRIEPIHGSTGRLTLKTPQ